VGPFGFGVVIHTVLGFVKLQKTLPPQEIPAGASYNRYSVIYGAFGGPTYRATPGYSP